MIACLKVSNHRRTKVEDIDLSSYTVQEIVINSDNKVMKKNGYSAKVVD